jgi:hypothetical protein
MRLRVLVIQGLGRIVDEVERDLQHLLVVGLDVGEVVGNLHQQADLLLAELGLDQADYPWGAAIKKGGRKILPPR